VRAEDVPSLGEAGAKTIHAACRIQELLEIDTPSKELFDLSTNPVDYSKVLTLYEAVENWKSNLDNE
jgi:hypothetical protein